MDHVIKRDGSITRLDPKKIHDALKKALSATGENIELAQGICDEVIVTLKKKFGDLKPTVEDIQDIVEEELIKNGKLETAKAYILYRQSRTDIRQRKEILGVKDTLKLSLNSLRLLEARYLRKDPETDTIESPADMLRRVAKAAAQADSNYKGNVEETEEKFYTMMEQLEFLPNSPALMNAGTDIGQLSACFVLPVDDSLEGIFETLKSAALIHQSGGGTGFSFSNIRPRGDIVKSTMGVASGPVSFMRIFDRATETIKQGGMRRGANMAVLSVNHPDILDFIRAKEQEDELVNFNISVAVSDDFISRAINNQSYELVNPRTGKPTKMLNARDVFDLIVMHAWETGDPGLIFIDEVNRRHPLRALGDIEATNPCGEVPLLPYESCNLGSVNLVKMFTDGAFDYKKLGETVKLAIHFLDNLIDVNNYPFPAVRDISTANRKIGLGIMGFADCLAKIGIPYNSQDALDFAEECISYIKNNAREMSSMLAKKRGSFPNIKKSLLDSGVPMRNATVTSIAPTGSISTIADVSSGIEPLFSVGYLRNALDTRMLVVNPMFDHMAKTRGFYSVELIKKVIRDGSIQNNPAVPQDVRRLFPTAHDIAPDFHVRMQAVFQTYVDNAVSKTINLSKDATLEQMRTVFLLAHKLKCKGITAYRYGCKNRQALEFGSIRTGDLCSDGVCSL